MRPLRGRAGPWATVVLLMMVLSSASAGVTSRGVAAQRAAGDSERRSSECDGTVTNTGQPHSALPPVPGATHKAMVVLPAHAVRWQPHATAVCSTAEFAPTPPARPRPAGTSCARSSPLDTSNFGIAFNSTSKVSVVKGKTPAIFNKHCFSVSRAAQQGLVPRPCASTAPCCGPQSLTTLVINAREWVGGWVGGGDYARMCAACALHAGCCMRPACGLHVRCMRPARAACGLLHARCMRAARGCMHAHNC